MREHAQALLRQMLGPEADFREGQWEAIEAVAVRRGRLLVVQRTGWGKSLVYFLSTKLMREQGAGPTMLISPLLALMRNQIEMAGRIGLRAVTIHSANRDEWDVAEKALASDSCDLLLISPERLNNERFLKSVLPQIAGRVGLFVVDEAHCISDWGHDFRPDYRRIVRILQNLPPQVPVLGTTATANDRVVADVQSQLGPGLAVSRGPLTRASLRLQALRIDDPAARLAWLVENLPKLPGHGIVYCLTVADTERVAGWLQSKGISAAAYHAGDDGTVDRVELEQSLLSNQFKALVATVALGMGFDKPDLGFVVHFQRPGSVVAYYQQVGRAGRALERAYGILLSGREDDEIQEYFIESAFPRLETMNAILKTLEPVEGMTLNEILAKVNVSRSMMEKALKLLEVDGAIGREGTKYFRTVNPWTPDRERVERVTELRRHELAQMQAYVDYKGCLMEFLARELDDPEAGPCGRCANCKGKGLSPEVRPELVIEAQNYLKGQSLEIAPRKMWPMGLFPDQKMKIPAELVNAPGRALCEYGDAGWGRFVRDGKYHQGRFDESLVQAAAELIQERWGPEPAPEWITAIPSLRHPTLVPDFAKRLAVLLGLPFMPVLVRTREMPEQKTMANSTMQAQNVLGSLAVKGGVPAGPVLLVDDTADSGWTMAMAGWLLRTKGSGMVHPFALARGRAR